MPAAICASITSAMSRAKSHAWTTSHARTLRKRGERCGSAAFSVAWRKILLGWIGLADAGLQTTLIRIDLCRAKFAMLHYPVASLALGGIERRIGRVHQVALGLRF